MEKYILTDETKEVLGVTLHRIKAIRSFGHVKEGDLGGWIEKEENLDQDGNAWVADNALVFGNAMVCDNALVFGNARVYGNTWVCDNALVGDNARVYGNARVSGSAQVSGNAWVSGSAKVSGDARVSGSALVKSVENIVYFSSVGSEHGTLTAYSTKTGEIEVTRGCFCGTLKEFESAVRKTHEDNRYAKEYLKLIEYIRLRFRDIKEDAK